MADQSCEKVVFDGGSWFVSMRIEIFKTQSSHKINLLKMPKADSALLDSSTLFEHTTHPLSTQHSHR